jgi:hypothetical protein
VLNTWRVKVLDKKYLIQYTSKNSPFNNKYYTKRQILDSVVIANEEYWNMLVEDTSIHSIGVIEEGVFYCPENSVPSSNDIAFWSSDWWCLFDAKSKKEENLS